MENKSAEPQEYIIEGMTCSGCASSIENYLKNNGFADANVNFATRELRFTHGKIGIAGGPISGIEKMGYRVWPAKEGNTDDGRNKPKSSPLRLRLFIAAVFTFPLLLHMFVPWHFLHNPYVQLLLSLPVLAIGILQFGRGAFSSIKAKSPNMDVLILTGAIAAFIYSLYGMAFHTADGTAANYLFFETTAAIITLVLLGNLIEDRAVSLTAKSLHALEALQPKMARKYTWNMASGDESIIEVPAASLAVNDFVQVNEGDRVPADGTVFSGRAEVDNSHLSGESNGIPVKEGDKVIAGALLVSGSLNVQISATGRQSSLGQIIRLVKDAQGKKPPIQRFGDRVSAIFVPAVLLISLAAFFINFYAFNVAFTPSIIRSIAILVIACPCAMGLATPTALMVGLGRAARMGIIIKDGATTERLAGIKTIVFDKTGTLTTGRFRFENWWLAPHNESGYWYAIITAMSKKSTHPIAKSVLEELGGEKLPRLFLKEIREEKGVGMWANDADGNTFFWGRPERGSQYDLTLKMNEKVVAGVNLSDDLKPEAAESISHLKKMGFRLAILSGDRDNKVRATAEKLGINTFYSECLPSQKLEIMERLRTEGPLVMVGDGINDAPALSAADVGISLGHATEVAQQSASVIITTGNLMHIPEAIYISTKTYKTIRQNLLWALLYNVVAIPIAGLGFLSPIIGAMSMAFSDLVVIGNSLRLRVMGFKSI